MEEQNTVDGGVETTETVEPTTDAEVTDEEMTA
jgi:hypothetical protein